MDRLRTPEQLLADVRREMIREAAIAELAERSRTSLGRVARRARLDVEEVRELFPGGLGEVLGLSTTLSVAA